ncbi:hypothetical protein PF001_g28124 [Phytophthora fragariae]|uniref:Uncharacterized protein n=1 Tax=Phytophthora fragariae TaxID=53985 RepID=A0A6A4BGF6_9STRA|nr:hypothetical protein PF001_g28124 [Phytophthora fragariae]
MEFMTPAGISLDLFHPGYARLDSGKYRNRQVQAYANSRNETLFGHEQRRNERWLAEQQSSVDRQDYPTQRDILTRATEAARSADECRTTSVEKTGLTPAVTDDFAGPEAHKPSFVVREDVFGHGDGEPTSSEDSNANGPTAHPRGNGVGGIDSIGGSAKVFKQPQGFQASDAIVVDSSRDGDADYGPSEGWNDHGAAPTRYDTSDYPDDGATDGTECLLDAGYASAVDAMPPEDPSCNEADATDTFNHRPNEAKPMENLENETKLTGYGDKSAFIPDSSEAMLTYSEPIGQSKGMDVIQREILTTNVPTPPVRNPRVMGQVTTKGSHRSWTLWILLLWTVAIAASAYLEDTAVTLVGYAGTSNGVSVTLEPKTEVLTTAGDSRFAIQQSLGAITCRWVKFMTQLCRHRDMTTKFQSVTNRHGKRDLNAAADYLVSQAMENEGSTVVSSEARLSQSSGLNRISNVTLSRGLTSIESSVSVAQASVAYISLGGKNFFDFVRGRAERDYDGDYSDFVVAVTRRETRSEEELARFANEVSVMGAGDAASREDSYEVPTEALGGMKLVRSNFEVKASDSCNMAPITILNEPSVGTSSDERAARNALDARPSPLLRRTIRVWPYMERGKPFGTAKLACRRHGCFRATFKVDWVGCEKLTREPNFNLSREGFVDDHCYRSRIAQRLQVVQVADDD